MFLLVAVLAIVCGILPWIVVAIAIADRREIRTLRARVEELERAAGLQSSTSVPPPRLERPRPAPPSPTPAAAPSIPSPPRTSREPTRLEEQVGAIWMQNVGSVLLLLGAFFLIVWGYAAGRVGPEALVLAGVALGIVLVWRGAVIARTIVALGNALIGVGLGVVYIALYLGHFRMHVMPVWAAFALLSLVSLVTVAVGMRRREPIIATLGVIGAHLPQLIAAWIPLQGFRLEAAALLGYFAVVNAVVFVLAATVGWSGLVILSLGLTSLTWCATFTGVPWGVGIQLSLTALFVALGVAPVIRHVRSPTHVRAVDLAVVAVAPILLLLSSLPFLASDRVRAAEFLLGVAAVYAIASGWVGSIRKEEDLWKPLTAAATVYLAAALERGLLADYLALAWCAEGAILVYLGLWRGGAWLRFLGYLVLGISALKLFAEFMVSAWSGGAFSHPLEGAAIRDLVCIVAFIALSHAIGRRKDQLLPEEQHVPELTVVVSNLLLMVWIAFEARPIARSTGALAPVLTSAGWSLQAMALFALGWIRDSAFLRWCGFVLFGMTILKFLLIDLDKVDAFWRFASAVGIGVALLAISFLYQRRARRPAGSASS